MIAWNLGVEQSDHPDLILQPPDTAYAAGMIAMTEERIRAVTDLGYDLFTEWMARGWRHRETQKKTD